MTIDEQETIHLVIHLVITGLSPPLHWANAGHGPEYYQLNIRLEIYNVKIFAGGDQMTTRDFGYVRESNFYL